jgi:hypothetical protein
MLLVEMYFVYRKAEIRFVEMVSNKQGACGHLTTLRGKVSNSITGLKGTEGSRRLRFPDCKKIGT